MPEPVVLELPEPIDPEPEDPVLGDVVLEEEPEEPGNCAWFLYFWHSARFILAGVLHSASVSVLVPRLEPELVLGDVVLGDVVLGDVVLGEVVLVCA